MLALLSSARTVVWFRIRENSIYQTARSILFWWSWPIYWIWSIIIIWGVSAKSGFIAVSTMAATHMEIEQALRQRTKCITAVAKLVFTTFRSQNRIPKLSTDQVILTHFCLHPAGCYAIFCLFCYTCRWWFNIFNIVCYGFTRDTLDT